MAIKAINVWVENSLSISLFLRTGQIHKYATEKNPENIISLANEIEREMKPAKEEYIVWRGLERSDMMSINFYDLKPGDIITDKSFMSTSIEMKVAKDFSRRGMLLRIIVKPGTLITRCGDNYHSYQKELLINRNTQFKVVNINDEVVTIETI